MKNWRYPARKYRTEAAFPQGAPGQHAKMGGRIAIMRLRDWPATSRRASSFPYPSVFVARRDVRLRFAAFEQASNAFLAI